MGALIISCTFPSSSPLSLPDSPLPIHSVILIFVWGNTIRTHFYYLAGAAAPLEFQQLVIYKAMTFAQQIEAIDTCVVYHNGPRYVVEVDLVMSGETPLRVAHDV